MRFTQFIAGVLIFSHCTCFMFLIIFKMNRNLIVLSTIQLLSYISHLHYVIQKCMVVRAEITGCLAVRKVNWFNNIWASLSEIIALCRLVATVLEIQTMLRVPNTIFSDTMQGDGSNRPVDIRSLHYNFNRLRGVCVDKRYTIS